MHQQKSSKINIDGGAVVVIVKLNGVFLAQHFSLNFIQFDIECNECLEWHA